MQEIGFIYTLSDPRTGHVFYVGQTLYPARRRNEHIRYGGNKYPKDRHISAMLAEGVEPELEVIYECPIGEVNFWEEHHIFLYRSWGFNLKNVFLLITQGTASVETRRNMSAGQKKLWSDPVYRERMIEKRREESTRVATSNSVKALWNNELYRRTVTESRNRWIALNKEAFSAASAGRLAAQRARPEIEAKRRANQLAAIQTDEYREVKRLEGLIRHKRPFYVTDASGGWVGVWENKSTCAADLKLNPSCITGCLVGRRISHRGYTFKYIDQQSDNK